MAIFCAIIYTSVLAFINVSVGLLTERWFIDDPRAEIKSGFLIALMWLVISVLDPALGLFLDKFGFRAIMV
jgi:hypothetical protein